MKAGDTFLLAAARKGAERIIEVLIAREAEVNCRDACGDTPLVLAARGGFLAIADLLMRAGARANDSNSEGMTALLEAIHNNHPRVARHIADKLQKRGHLKKFFSSCRAIDRTDIAEPSLSQCAEYGWVKAAQVLIRLGVDVNTADQNGVTPLAAAVTWNRAEMAKLLLEHQARGLHDACITAAGAGHVEMLSFLLEREKSSAVKTTHINAPDARGITALMAAAQNGHCDALNLLLEKGADFRVTSQDNNVFTLAAANNQIGAMRVLVQRPEVQNWLMSNAGENTRKKVSQIAKQEGIGRAIIVLPQDSQLPPGFIRVFSFEP